jgi:hypothetical protein
MIYKIVAITIFVLLLILLVRGFMPMTPKYISDEGRLMCIADTLLSQEAKIENEVADLSSVPAIKQGLGTRIFREYGPSTDKNVTITFNPNFKRLQTDWVAIARRNDWRNRVYGPLILWGDGRIERSRESPDSQADPNSVQVYFYIEGIQ